MTDDEREELERLRAEARGEPRRRAIRTLRACLETVARVRQDVRAIERELAAELQAMQLAEDE